MQTWLCIGLGNPGREYENTRHNLGVRLLQTWVKEADGRGRDVRDWHIDSSVAGKTAQVHVNEESTVYCLFPLTYMNESGRAVVAFLKHKPVAPERLLIIHDDLEIPFGESAFQPGGSARGHKGVKSIQQVLGTLLIPRLRLGIGRPVANTTVESYVLQPFSAAEETQMPAVLQKGIDAIESFLSSRSHPE